MADPIPVNQNRGYQQQNGYPVGNNGGYHNGRNRADYPLLTRKQWIAVILLTLLLLDKNFLSFLGKIESGNFSLLSLPQKVEQPHMDNSDRPASIPANSGSGQPDQPQVSPLSGDDSLGEKYSWLILHSWPAAKVEIGEQTVYAPSSEPINVPSGRQRIRFIPVDYNLQVLEVDCFFEPDVSYEISCNLETGCWEINKNSKEDN